MPWESILVALITGVLSILGVVLTLRQNNKQLIIERQERREEKFQKIWDTRPELEIIDCKKYPLTKDYLVDDNYYFECILFRDNEQELSNPEDWFFVEYTLKNIGKEMIEYLDFIPLQYGLYCGNLKLYFSSNIFEIASLKRNKQKNLTYYGNKIRTNDTFKVRVLFLKDFEPRNFPTVSCCIAFKSFNKKYWRQNFYVPSKTLEESVLITEKGYNELTTRVE